MVIGKTLIEIIDLKVSYGLGNNSNTVLNGLNLEIRKEEILALVGASGCGKSTVALSIFRLLNPQAKLEEGKILYNGIDLLRVSGERMRKVRGEEISIIFQEPLSALNPVFNIGYQMSEVLKFHSFLEKEKYYQKMIDSLKLVGIPSPDRVLRCYPHQLSGGMRQRVVIAMSIIVNPKLIIADEPTSNLDVTLQVQILDLFRRLKEDLGLSILLITHDLTIVENIADRICVINQGRIVEENITPILMRCPENDYTRQLIESSDFKTIE